MAYLPRVPVRIAWRTRVDSFEVIADTVKSAQTVFDALKLSPEIVEISARDAADFFYRSYINPDAS